MPQRSTTSGSSTKLSGTTPTRSHYCCKRWLRIGELSAAAEDGSCTLHMPLLSDTYNPCTGVNICNNIFWLLAQRSI
jgi:hypothetical protein